MGCGCQNQSQQVARQAAIQAALKQRPVKIPKLTRKIFL